MDVPRWLIDFRVWIPVAGFGLVLLAVWRRTRARKNRAPARLEFDLILPSKWAAELCDRVLETEGTSSEVMDGADGWICRVTEIMDADAQAWEKRRRHLNQIANGRGGDCPSYRAEHKGRAVSR